MLTFFLAAALTSQAPEPWRVEGRSLYAFTEDVDAPRLYLPWKGERDVLRLAERVRASGRQAYATSHGAPGVEWIREAAKAFDGLRLEGTLDPDAFARCRDVAALPLTAALGWDAGREDVDGKPAIARAQDALDWVSITAPAGVNRKRLLLALEARWAYRPGRLELTLAGEGAEGLFAAARERFGRGLMEAWRPAK